MLNRSTLNSKRYTLTTAWQGEINQIQQLWSDLNQQLKIRIGPFFKFSLRRAPIKDIEI
jgi:hypothetical protein